MLLFDTSIFSCMLRKNAEARLYHPELTSDAALYMSVQALGEVMLWTHVRRWEEKRKRRLDQLLSQFAILPIDPATAHIYGEVVFAARSLGRPLSPQDAWIVATAKQYGLTLVTHDLGMTVAEQFGVTIICRA